MKVKPIRQEHLAGCGVSCVAVILGINYQSTLRLFYKGKAKAKLRGFYCKELVNVLNKSGLQYEIKYVNKNKVNIKKKIYKDKTIVFIRSSNRYPLGHYLLRINNK